MKSVRRTVRSDKPPKITLGTFLGLGVLSIAPLTAGVALLTTRYLALRDMQAAKSWVETPCVMEKCEYVTHQGSDGGRSLEIVYRYEVDGKEYRGDRLDLLIGSMGDDDVMEKSVFESFPPGAAATCYVDPADPANSVFDRDHASSAPRRLWLLAFPFLCAGLGLGLVLVCAIISGRRKVTAPPEPEAGPSAFVSDPGPPPRRIPLLTQASVLAGPASSQMAWLFFVGFVFVFVLMDGPACYARLFNLWQEDAQTVGRVTDVSAQEAQELYVRVYRYTFDYEVDGQAYTSTSFSRGQHFNEGDEVTVAYDPAAPDDGSIAGTRPSDFTWWHSAIPLGVLLLLAFGLVAMYVHNVRVLWLLNNGRVARAQWREPEPSQTGQNPVRQGPGQRDADADSQEGSTQIPTMLSDFQFEIGGRTYRAKKYSPATRFRRRWRDPPNEVLVLHDPYKPARNIILGGALASLVDGRRSVTDRLVDCLPAPMAAAALVFLFSGAS